jgi:hypothetical protein
MKAALALVAMLISGCAEFQRLPAEVKAEEVTWQSLHALDTAQSLSVARDPDCYFESFSDPIIGRHPSEGLVLAWMAVAGTLHFLITDWLIEHNHTSLARTWEAISIGSTAYSITHNQHNGVRPFGHNEPAPGTCREND